MLSFYLPPQYFEILTLKGVDAAKFLQGQLTCDVAALDETGFSYGAICNIKGRVITAFIIFKRGECFHLIFNQGLSALFVTTLKKYQPFYKCEMYLNETMSCLAIVGEDSPSSDDVVERLNIDGGSLLTLNTELKQSLYCLDQAQMKPKLEHCAATLLQDKGTLWQISTMQAGHYPFAVDDSEQFTPQDLHYDRKGYISFSKGCYTGQEIVARMHYRGKIKKQLHLVTIELTGPQEAPEALDLLDTDGNIVTRCSKIAINHENQLSALALLPVETPENTPLLSALGPVSTLRIL